MELLVDLGSLTGWGQGVPPALLIRILLALAVLPLLYRALGEEGQGWGGGPAHVARRLFFALLGGALFFGFSHNWAPDERAGAQGRGFEAYVKGVYLYRASYAEFAGTRVAAAGQNPRQEALEALRESVRHAPRSVTLRRTLGIARADAGDYAAAREHLSVVTEELRKRAPDGAERESALWNTLFGPEPPSQDAIQAAQRTVRDLQLGWQGNVALLAAYRRTEERAKIAEWESIVTREANRYFQRMLSGILFPLFIVPQLGLIVLVVGMVLIGQRVLRPAPVNLHPVGAVLWEGFILMLAMGFLPLLWEGGVRRTAPETAPAQFAMRLLVRDATQVLAVVYLWWRLRGKGLGLAEIGLTRRKLGANLLIGVLAALVMMPTAYLVNCGTQFVSDRFFPDVAPPYHPLGGMTAGSSSAEIRWALFAAAAIGAPLFEEIFFRGCLYGALRRRFGFWLGLLGSSAFFAILHPQLPLGFLPIAFLGAVFCVLYEWRQSLVPAMVAHAVNNGLAFLMLSLLFPTRG